MKAQPHPVDSTMYFLISASPWITGARRPASAAMSTKWALKGRPEALGLGRGLAV
jgi:hypothetical protein